jgi:hypothetical protein
VTSHLRERARGTWQRGRLACRRWARASMPWLRRATRAINGAAAIAFIVMIGSNHDVEAPPLDQTWPEATSPSTGPSERDLSIPAPAWRVHVPELPDREPVVPAPHLGFIDPPDLSEQLEAGVTRGGARGGTDSGWAPPHVNGAALRSTVLFVAVLLTLTALIGAWIHWRPARGAGGVDDSGETAGVVADELPEDAGEAGGPAKPGASQASEASEASEANVAQVSPTPEVQAVDSAAGDLGGDAAPAPELGSREDTGRGSTTRESAASTPARDNLLPSTGPPASRVVLFTATTWGS